MPKNRKDQAKAEELALANKLWEDIRNGKVVLLVIYCQTCTPASNQTMKVC